MAEYFIALANGDLGTHVMGLSEEALKCLVDYEFPGNVRELKNIIYKAVLETKSGLISKLEIPQRKRTITLESAVEEILNSTPEEELKTLLSRVEVAIIKKLLERYGGNKSKVASLLGISRNTLDSKLRSVGE